MTWCNACRRGVYWVWGTLPRTPSRGCVAPPRSSPQAHCPSGYQRSPRHRESQLGNIAVFKRLGKSTTLYKSRSAIISYFVLSLIVVSLLCQVLRISVIYRHVIRSSKFNVTFGLEQIWFSSWYMRLWGEKIQQHHTSKIQTFFCFYFKGKKYIFIIAFTFF